MACRRLNTIRPPAVIGLVQVQRENIVFRIGSGELERQGGLAQLAAEAPLTRQCRVEQEAARQLLRNRRSARRERAAAQIRPGRSRNPAHIYPWVGVEARIFDRNGGLAQRQRHSGKRHRALPTAQWIG